MSSYKKSEITRDAVIDACKKLFFENGYIATHYNDIVAESGISPGLIHYHFKKKGNIAGIIYTNFLETNKCFVEEALKENYELQIGTAVEIRNYWNLFTQNERLFRFFYEIAKERIIVECFKEVGENFYDLHKKRYHLPINEEQLKLINISSSAFESEAIIALYEGYLGLSITEVCEFVIRTVYEFMGIDYNRIEEIIKLSAEVYESLDIHLEDYFRLV